MDLPKNIQALDSIYDIYWNNTKTNFDSPLSFDRYYDEYFKLNENNIKEFWSKTGFGLQCDCFPKGLKARIYRTWASLITQIHAGYVAESVFGKGAIEQSTLLDHNGIDILVHYKNINIGIQVKKESKRPEISRMYSYKDRIHKGAKKEYKNLDLIDIWYIVPQPKDYDNPFYQVKSKKGQLRDSIKQFVKFNPNEGTLNRLENGFIIFTKKEFEIIKELVDLGIN